MGRGGVIVGYYMLVGLLCVVICYIYILVDNVISSLGIYIYIIKHLITELIPT